MNLNIKYFLLVLALAATEVNADNGTLDAAIGGAIGGATGAVIGNEIGGRDGAIVGGALGAAIGTTITTNQGQRNIAPPRNHYYATPPGYPRYQYSYPRNEGPGYHCPPGQAKKGRC
jgi:hypothetical protein